MSRWYEVHKTYIETILVEVPDDEADPVVFAVDTACNVSKENVVDLELFDTRIELVPSNGLQEAKQWADVVVPLEKG